VGEVGDDGGDVRGVKQLEHVRGQYGLSHTRASHRHHAVHLDVVLVLKVRKWGWEFELVSTFQASFFLRTYSLNSQRVSKAQDSHLRRAVVGLAKVAVQARARANVDDSAVLLALHDGPDGVAEVEGALEVHVQHRTPVLLGHLSHGLVSQNSSVIDDDVAPTERLQGALHDLVGLEDTLIVGDRLATACQNLANNLA